MTVERNVRFAEICGELTPGCAGSGPGDIVLLSNLHRGHGITNALPGICLRYVGRGRESYAVGRHGFHLGEDQIMVVSANVEEAIDVPARDRNGTIGLCVLVEPDPEDMPWVAGPLVFSAARSRIGAVMREHARSLTRPGIGKAALARSLTQQLRSELPGFTGTVLDQAAAIDAAKASTRFEMVRRANLAQAYLHSVTDRAVPLDELAREVATSPFQLLRGFQKCFRESPAAYHRRLRLQAVVDSARRREISLGAAAQDFGFADGSSFSHAYRRAFGVSPVRGEAKGD